MSSTDNSMRLHTQDEIQVMSGRELHKLMSNYKDILYNKKGDTEHASLQVEYCYLQRELQERENLNLAFDKNRRGE